MPDTTFADSLASVSRKLAQTKARKISETLFRYYPAKSGVVTIHDFDGDLSIALDRASYITSAIYWAGNHSFYAARFLRKFLKPEMVIADIGANVGEITLLAAKRLTRGRVLSFEPMPRVYAQLRRNIELNGFKNVSTFNMGLFHESGTLPLFVKSDNPYGMTNEGVTSLFSDGTARQVSSVPLRRFDDVAEESGITRLDLMKIDVEGAEWMVLRGAQRAIERFRPVIIAEISESNFHKAGYTTEDLYRFLKSLGYEILSLETMTPHLSSECDAICFPRSVTP